MISINPWPTWPQLSASRNAPPTSGSLASVPRGRAGCSSAVRAQNVPPEPSTLSAWPGCWHYAVAGCRASRSLVPPSSPKPPSPASCSAIATASPPWNHRRRCAALSAHIPAISSISTSRNSPASCAPATLVTGDRQHDHSRGAGWEFLPIAIDDPSRVAFAQILPDESSGARKPAAGSPKGRAGGREQTAHSAIAFLHAALAFLAKLGLHAKRLSSDNGSCDRSRARRAAIAALGLKQRFTRPSTPKTNGKAERFIQTSLREWACAYAYSHSSQRSERLPSFLHNDNWHRPHHSLNLLAPISRLLQPLNNLFGVLFVARRTTVHSIFMANVCPDPASYLPQTLLYRHAPYLERRLAKPAAAILV